MGMSALKLAQRSTATGTRVRCGGGKVGLGVRGMFVGEDLNLSELIGIKRKVSYFL